MGVHSGRWTSINGVNFMSSWQIDDDTDTKEYVASNTKAGKGRLPGIGSWTGSIEQLGGIPSGSPAYMPGIMFSFTGYEAPDDDVAGHTGVTLSGQAMVERMTITWNWQSGEIVKMASEFQGHLGLTYADGQTAIFDTAPPTFYGSKQIATPKIQVNNAGGFVDWPNLTTCSLTISNEVQPYVNSSTAGLTGRLAGPWDLDFTATEQEVLRTLFVKDDILDIKLPVDNSFTKFWHIQWLHVKNFTNIRVDRETGKVIEQTINAPWSVWDAETTPVLGQIILPDGTVFWPITGS